MSDLYKSLLEFQKECPTVKPDMENRHLKQKYATRGQILKTIMPVLNKHGLILLQRPVQNEVHTLIYHADSKDYIDLGYVTYENGEGDRNPDQAKGKSLQYALRYGLNALGIVTDEDPQSNTGNSNTKVSAPPKRTIEQARVECIKALQKAGQEIDDETKEFINAIDSEDKLKEFYTSSVSKD